MFGYFLLTGCMPIQKSEHINVLSGKALFRAAEVWSQVQLALKIHRGLEAKYLFGRKAQHFSRPHYLVVEVHPR